MAVLAALEISLSGRLSLRGISPDLLACFAVYSALYWRPASGVAWAWGTGLVTDLLFGFKLGPFAISYAGAAYVLAGTRANPFRGSHLVHSVATLIATFATHIGFWLMHCIYALWAGPGVEIVGLGSGLATASGVAVYSAAVAPLVFEARAWAVGRVGGGTPRR